MAIIAGIHGISQEMKAVYQFLLQLEQRMYLVRAYVRTMISLCFLVELCDLLYSTWHQLSYLLSLIHI